MGAAWTCSWVLGRSVGQRIVGTASGEVAKALRQPLPAADYHWCNGAEMASPWIRGGPFPALCVCVEFAPCLGGFWGLSMKP
jgi:hypothetical protein